MIQGEIQLPKMDGKEVSPGIFLIGEPTPVEGTAKLRSLANVDGALCVVELSLKFIKEKIGFSAEDDAP